MPRNPTETAIAYHEAGHAVAACLYGVPFHYVTIRENGSSLGHISHFQAEQLYLSKAWRTRFNKQIALMCAAGAVAEAMYHRLGRRTSTDKSRPFFYLSSSDIEGMWATLKQNEVACGLDDPRILQVECEFAKSEAWAAIEELASHLIQMKTLSGTEAARIVRRHVAVRWPK